MPTPDFNELFYFAQVVIHGGFSPASRVLGIPKSRLSRQVASLEARLGAQLILRSSRSFTVTEVGKRFYTHCEAMLVEARAAEESVAMTLEAPSGIVRLSCPVALLATRVGKILSTFMVKYPRVQLFVEESNRRVDVIGDGIDIAIRVRPLPLQDSDLVLRDLAERRQCLVASPHLLAKMGKSIIPEDLSLLPSMDVGIPKDTHRWIIFNTTGERAEVRHKPRYVTHSMYALRDAALDGVGVVQLPIMMVRDELERGLLMPALPGWEPPPEKIHAVYASRRGQLPAVRALLDFLSAQFKLIEEE